MAERQSISTAPQDGRPVFIGDENGNIARARWTQGTWAYDVPADGAIAQIDFTPTHWSDGPHDFLGELVIAAAGRSTAPRGSSPLETLFHQTEKQP